LIQKEIESVTVTAARNTILNAVAQSAGSATLAPEIVADAFPGAEMTERCEALLYWAEMNDLNVKSHNACDPDGICEAWPCGPIDFDGRTRIIS
jgi:hypothetical protein